MDRRTRSLIALAPGTMAVFGTPLAHYIDSFVKEVDDDLASPAQSKFQEGMPNIKRNVLAMEEVGKFIWKAGLYFPVYFRHCLATRVM